MVALLCFRYAYGWESTVHTRTRSTPRCKINCNQFVFIDNDDDEKETANKRRKSVILYWQNEVVNESVSCHENNSHSRIYRDFKAKRIGKTHLHTYTQHPHLMICIANIHLISFILSFLRRSCAKYTSCLCAYTYSPQIVINTRNRPHSNLISKMYSLPFPLLNRVFLSVRWKLRYAARFNFISCHSGVRIARKLVINALRTWNRATRLTLRWCVVCLVYMWWSSYSPILLPSFHYLSLSLCSLLFLFSVCVGFDCAKNVLWILWYLPRSLV